MPAAPHGGEAKPRPTGARTGGSRGDHGRAHPPPGDQAGDQKGTGRLHASRRVTRHRQRLTVPSAAAASSFAEWPNPPPPPPKGRVARGGVHAAAATAGGVFTTPSWARSSPPPPPRGGPRGGPFGHVRLPPPGGGKAAANRRVHPPAKGVKRRPRTHSPPTPGGQAGDQKGTGGLHAKRRVIRHRQRLRLSSTVAASSFAEWPPPKGEGGPRQKCTPPRQPLG